MSCIQIFSKFSTQLFAVVKKFQVLHGTSNDQKRFSLKKKKRKKKKKKQKKQQQQ